jgi:hypothetical protein
VERGEEQKEWQQEPAHDGMLAETKGDRELHLLPKKGFQKESASGLIPACLTGASG